MPLMQVDHDKWLKEYKDNQEKEKQIETNQFKDYISQVTPTSTKKIVERVVDRASQQEVYDKQQEQEEQFISENYPITNFLVNNPVTQAVASFGAGAEKGLGISYVRRLVQPDSEAGLEKMRQENPIASTVGQITGMALPFSRASSIVGKAGTSIASRLASTTAGKAVANIATKAPAIVQGVGNVAKVAAREGIAGGAIGAIYGGVDEATRPITLSDLVTGNDKRDILGKALETGKEYGEMGALLGGGLSAVGKGVGAIAKNVQFNNAVSRLQRPIENYQFPQIREPQILPLPPKASISPTIPSRLQQPLPKGETQLALPSPTGQILKRIEPNKFEMPYTTESKVIKGAEVQKKPMTLKQAEPNLSEYENRIHEFTSKGDMSKNDLLKLRKELNNENGEIFTEQMKFLNSKDSRGNKPTQGNLVKDAEGNVINRKGRTSNNELWYQEWAKENRTWNETTGTWKYPQPTQKQLKELAEKQLTGTTETRTVQGKIPPNDAYIHNQNTIKAIDSYISKVEKGEIKTTPEMVNIIRRTPTETTVTKKVQDSLKARLDELKQTKESKKPFYVEPQFRKETLGDTTRNVRVIEQPKPITKEITQPKAVQSEIKPVNKPSDIISPLKENKPKYAPETQSKFDALEQKHIENVNRLKNDRVMSPEFKAKQQLSEGMRYSARKREIIQGDSLIPVEGGLTAKELANKITYQKSNYSGKKVMTPDGEGTATGKSVYGKVEVKLNDGIIKSYPKESVKGKVDVDAKIKEQTKQSQAKTETYPSDLKAIEERPSTNSPSKENKPLDPQSQTKIKSKRKLPELDQMTQKEIDSHYGLDQKYSAKNIMNLVEDTGAKVINKVGRDNVPSVIEYYTKKYNLPKISYGFKLKEGSKSGTTQPIKYDAYGKAIEYKININPNLSTEGKIGALRHEIEHVIDLNSGYKPSTKANLTTKQKQELVSQTTREGYSKRQVGEHKNYGWFEADYIRRAMVKDALKSGKKVPQSVLDELPDLKNVKIVNKPMPEVAQSEINHFTEKSNIKSPTNNIDANKPIETKFDYESTIGRSEGTGAVKERGYSENVRTNMNAEKELRQMFDEKPEFYNQLTNKKTLENAQRRFNRGYDEALKEFDSIKEFTPEDVPLSHMLANEAVKRGEFSTARRIITEVAHKLTESGQFSQAARIMRKSDPAAFNMYLDRRVIKLNIDGRRLYGEKWKDIKLSEKMQKEIYNLEIIDETSMERLMNNAYENIASQMPATKLEKFDSWRRMAMLLNPKTHVRNFLGNSLMMGLRKTSDTIGSGFEKVFLKEGQRTKSFNWSKDTNLVEKVNADWVKNRESLMKGGRWDIEGMSIGNADKRIFKTETLEKINVFSKKALEAGDEIFLGRAYKDALGQYMKANRLSEVTEAGKLYAERRALESTFRANNALAQFITRAKKAKGYGRLVEAAIPFSKTPSNIAKSALDYSPAGIIKSLWSGGVQKDATKMIEELSKGLTGTAILGTGFLLGMNGWARLNRDKSKKAEGLMNVEGEQPNSIITPYGSYTFDWLQPASVPLAAGVSIYENLIKNTNPDKLMPMFNVIVDTILSGTDTVFNMTMLRNIKDAIGGGGYTSTSQAIANLPIDYLEQTFPTVLGQTARSVDDVKRNTYDRNYAKSFWNQTLSKIPFASKNLPAKINILGEEEKQMGVLGQTISPGTGKQLNQSPLLKELDRLFEKTKTTDMIPTVAPKSFEFEGKSIYLDGKEIERMQRRMGYLNKETLTKEINSAKYVRLKTDEEKARHLKGFIDQNYITAKKELLENRGIITKVKKGVIPFKTLKSKK